VSCAVVVEFARRDWSLPPARGSIRQIRVTDDTTTKLYPSRELPVVLDRLESLSDDECAAGFGIPMLLACAVWNAGRSTRHQKLERRLYRLVRTFRVIEVPLLTVLTQPFRDFASARRGELAVSARAYDTMTPRDPQERSARVRDMLGRIFCWIDRRHGGPRVYPDRFYGVDIETIATAVGHAVQWRGARVDYTRARRLLNEARKRPGGLKGSSIAADYEAVIESARPDSLIHPDYYLQDGKRLGAKFPAYQSFTRKGETGHASSGLLVPRDGCRLLCLDVRQAEFLTMGRVWAFRYPDDPRGLSYLRAVLNGYRDGRADIHQRVGDLVAAQLPDMAAGTREIRALGKTINSTLVNGGTNRALAKAVRSARIELGLPGAVQLRDMERVLQPLEAAFPVERWRRELESFGDRRMTGAVDLPDGRRMGAEDGRQFASRLTQTYFADAFAIAVYEMVRAGWCPSLLRYDEVVVDLGAEEDPADPENVFVAGFREVFEDARVACVRTVYRKRWGIE